MILADISFFIYHMQWQKRKNEIVNGLVYFPFDFS